MLDDLYRGATDRTLGPWWVFDIPIFSVWAPTAQNVVLLADPPGGDSTETRVQMFRDQDGIWTVWGKPGWRGGTYR